MNVVISALLAAHGATVIVFQKGALLELYESPFLTSFAQKISRLPMAFDYGAVGKSDVELVSDNGQCLFPSAPIDGHGYDCFLIHGILQ